MSSGEVHADVTDTTSVSQQSSPAPRRSPLASIALASAAVLGGLLALIWRPSLGVERVSAALTPALDEPLVTAPAAVTKDDVLLVTADCPVASLQIGARVVPVPAPARSIRVTLEPAERSTKLVARSIDGRTATVPISGAGVSIVFPTRQPTRQPTPEPSTAPPPAPERRLAKSPYDP